MRRSIPDIPSKQFRIGQFRISSMRFTPGKLGQDTKLMIVGYAPSMEDSLRQEPFSGPIGSLLSEDLEDAGYSLSYCYRTNVFKYPFSENQNRKFKEISSSLSLAVDELQKEINVIKPNVILALGEETLGAFTSFKNKISDYRGSILRYNNRKLIATYDPQKEIERTEFRPWQKYIRKFDIQRAVNESITPDFNLPQRLLHICGSSSSLRDFLSRNENKEYCAIDIESIEGIPVCIGLSFSIHEAISVPLWNSVNISAENLVSPKKSYSYKLEVSSIPDGDLAYIWRILAELFLNRKIKFIGQNFKYDEAKLNNLGFYFHSLYYDTLIGQHVISSELLKSLAFQTSIYTREPYYKNEGKDYVPGRDSIRDLFLYNCKDAACTLEIFFAHLNELGDIPGALNSALNFRMRLHKVYLDIESEGFTTDDKIREGLIRKYIARQIALEREAHELLQFFGINEIVNFASPKQLQEVFFVKLKIPQRKGTGEEVLTALLANTVKDQRKQRILEIVLEWRGVNKTIGTYLAAENDYDGKMRTTYQICGTESYRTSTQVVRQPLRPKEIGWALQTVTKHGDTGQDLRSILVAKPGYIFLNVDQSQAEARVCSLLADDPETLSLYDTNDIHALTAAAVFGGTEAKWSKKVLGYECPERYCGKTARHAYHLAIGKRELMINMNTDARKYKIPLNISEYKANLILEGLRRMTPKIETVFHAQIQECLSKDRRLFGVYGASFYFYEEWGRDLLKAAYSRIPQQAVTDTTKKVAIWAHKEIWDCPVLGESHDALLFLCPERKVHDYIPLIQSKFSEPIDFSSCSLPRNPLSIPSDVEVGYDYQDLNKYKLNMTLRKDS